MTLRELVKELNALMPVHGDCDVCTTSTDGGEYIAPVRKVWSNVTPAEGEGFPIVVLVVETDQGDVLPDGREGREDAGLNPLKGEPVRYADLSRVPVVPGVVSTDLDVDDTPECPCCPRGVGYALGFLGKTLWFRCRQCGEVFRQCDMEG